MLFCREMFAHINKKGMEVTLQFLFNRLDSHLAYEEFRYSLSHCVLVDFTPIELYSLLQELVSCTHCC